MIPITRLRDSCMPLLFGHANDAQRLSAHVRKVYDFFSTHPRAVIFRSMLNARRWVTARKAKIVARRSVARSFLRDLSFTLEDQAKLFEPLNPHKDVGVRSTTENG
jgi:hypothetical protein